MQIKMITITQITIIMNAWDHEKWFTLALFNDTLLKNDA